MRCYSKLIRIVIGALSLERTYRMQVITFLTPFSPAPCAKKYRSEHQTLFPRFGRVWERDYKQLSRLNHIELINVRQRHYVVVYDCILSQDGDYPLDEPPLSEEFIITVFYNLVHFFMLLSLHLTIGIATSPVLFNVFVTVCFSQFMQRTYVYHTRELNGLMSCTIHVNLTG